MDEVVHDHMMEWHYAMKMKVACLKDKMKDGDDDDHHDKHIKK
jgi:hypothetical protein